MVVRGMPRASAEWVGVGVQKLARKALSVVGGIAGAGGGWEDDAVVIAGDGEDGAGVISVGVVELVVVVLVFAEAVDDVAEVVEELRERGGGFVDEVGEHLVDGGVLGLGTDGGAGVSDAVEDDAAGGLDGRYGGVAGGAESGGEGEDGLGDWGRPGRAAGGTCWL